MTIKEMVEIMQYYDNGGEIEVRNNVIDRWLVAQRPLWNWQQNNYRIREKPIPTHKEIMTKWWKTEYGWRKICNYNEEANGGQGGYSHGSGYEFKRYFQNLRSADIPPEE